MPRIMNTKDGRAALRLAKLVKECDSAAEAVKKIGANGHNLKPRLSTIINEFSTSLLAVTSTLNQVVMHVEGTEKSKLSSVTKNLFDVSSILQRFFLHDLKTVKEKLIFALHELQTELEVLYEIAEVTDTNVFVQNQIRYAVDEIMLAVYKLKFQAPFFTKSYGDMCSILTEALTQVRQADFKVETDNPTINDEMWHILQYVEDIYVRITCRLENWLRMNNGQVKTVNAVSVFCDTISKNTNKLHQIIRNNNGTATLMLDKARPLYEEGYKDVKGLLEINGTGLGGEEYIRSVLCDASILATWVYDNLEMAHKSSKP